METRTISRNDFYIGFIVVLVALGMIAYLLLVHHDNLQPQPKPAPAPIIFSDGGLSTTTAPPMQWCQAEHRFMVNCGGTF